MIDLPYLTTTMGATTDHIPEKYLEWIKKQEVFWVATAPLAADGHVNVSPKGLRGSFFIESPNRGGINSNAKSRFIA